MKKSKGELVLASVFLSIFVVLIAISLGYGKKARRMPLVVGIPGIALSAIQAFRGVMGELSHRKEITERRVPEKESLEVGVQKKRLEMVGWVSLLVGMIWVFGFLITIPVYMTLFMKSRKEKWPVVLAMSTASFAALYFLFVHSLSIELYPGLLFKRY